MSALFRVGLLTSAHGIKGAVKVYPTTDDPERFLDLETVLYSRTQDEEDIVTEYHIDRVQFSQKIVILTFREVTDRNQAETLRGGSLWIPDEVALPLEEDEFYIRDFMEATVKEEDGSLVGSVLDIVSTGSNEVLLIKDTEGKEWMIPVIKDCIIRMDAEKKEIIVHLLKGLRP